MLKEDSTLVKLAKKYKLQPLVDYHFDTLSNKIVKSHWFSNSAYDLERFFDDEEFKALNLSSYKASEELFNYFDISYSQENEFYID